MKKIKNPWKHARHQPDHYEVKDTPSKKMGDFAIYPTPQGSYLFTYKDKALTELAGPNKGLLEALHKGERPAGVQGFLFDRAMDRILKEFGKLPYS